MKIAITLLLSIFLSTATAFSQQGRPPAQVPQQGQMTAVNTLWAFGRERGTELERVVGIVGFYGQDQPAQWRLLAHDALERGMMREYIVENGRVVSERRFRRQAGEDLPSIVIPVASLSVDSNQVFLLAEGAARAEGVGFDSVHYQLRCRDLRNEPVWVLNLSDQLKKTVGVLYISAINGEIIRKVWNRPGTKEYDQQGKRTDGVGDYLQRSKGFLTRTFNSMKSKASSGQASKNGSNPNGASPKTSTQPQPQPQQQPVQPR